MNEEPPGKRRICELSEGRNIPLDGTPASTRHAPRVVIRMSRLEHFGSRKTA
jgi:hypothetical protein